MGVKLGWSEMWQIFAYVSRHSCSHVVRTDGHRGAASWIISHALEDKFVSIIYTIIKANILEPDDFHRSLRIEENLSRSMTRVTVTSAGNRRN